MMMNHDLSVPLDDTTLDYKISRLSMDATPTVRSYLRTLVETEEDYQEFVSKFDCTFMGVLRFRRAKFLRATPTLDEFLAMATENLRCALEKLFLEPVDDYTFKCIEKGVRAGDNLDNLYELHMNNPLTTIGRYSDGRWGYRLEWRKELRALRNEAVAQQQVDDVAGGANNDITEDISDDEAQGDVTGFGCDDVYAQYKARVGQQAFAESVKTNYGWRCAVTGIETTDFLVASHIVPWASSKESRLDPANAICLSVLVDRAFDKGYITISDDYKVILSPIVNEDTTLFQALKPYEGETISLPTVDKPKLNYLRWHHENVFKSDGQ